MSKYQVDPKAYVEYLLGLDPETADSRNWKQVHPLIYGDDAHQPNLELYVQLMSQAAEQTDKPVLKCWFLLEEVNGLRRQLTRTAVQRASVLLTEIKSEIDSLTSPRKERLLNLWGYQSGETFRLLGDFAKSAECHEASAQSAKTERDRLHAQYMAAYEWLNYALVLGQNIEQRYSEFLGELYLFSNLLTPRDADDQYSIQWKGNLTWHYILYNFLVKGSLPAKEQVILLEGLPANLKQAFSEATTVARALAQLKQEPQACINILFLSKSVWENPDFHALALLVEAEAYQRLAQTSESREKVKQASQIPQQALGGYVAAAIAQRKRKLAS